MLLNYDGLNRSKNAKNKGEQKNIGQTKFGTGELRHKFWKISLTSAQAIILYGAEVTRAENRWPRKILVKSM